MRLKRLHQQIVMSVELRHEVTIRPRARLAQRSASRDAEVSCNDESAANPPALTWPKLQPGRPDRRSPTVRAAAAADESDLR